MDETSNNTTQAFWVAIGSFSSFALTIVSAAILSRYIDKGEYGTYRQILYVYNTLLIVFSAGLPKVFAYYLPRFSLAQGKSVVWKISKILFFTGVVFSATLYLLSGVIADILKNPELAIGLKYFSPIPMFLLPTMGIEGIFSSYKKTVYIAVYNVVSRLTMLLLIVLPVVLLHGSYLNAIYGWIVASVLTLLLAYYFKGIPFRGILAEKVDLPYTEIFTYSLPLLIASLAGMAISAADQFFISRYFGAEVFAEFSNGFISLPFVGMITVASATVLLPEFSRIVHEGPDYSRVITLWRNALLKSAIIIYPLVIFFIIYANQVIELLFSSAYLNSVVYFRIAIIINFFHIIMFAPLMLAMGKVKTYSYLHIVFALLVWVGEYVVVLLLNSPVAVAATSIFLAVLKVATFTFYTARLIDVSLSRLIPWKRIGQLIAHSIFVMALVKSLLGYTAPNIATIFELMASLTCFLFLLLASSRLFGLDYLWAIRPVFEKLVSKRAKA